MKCPHCQMEWTDKPGVTDSLKNCPFCGGSLPQNKKPETLEDCLCVLFQRFGEDPFRSGKGLVSLHSDLFPERQRDRRLLTLLLLSDGNTFMLDALKSPAVAQSNALSRLAKKMEEEWMIKPDAIREVCSAFWLAVNGTKDALKAIAEKPAQPSPAPKANAPKQASAPTSTAPAHTVCNTGDFQIKNGTLVKFSGSDSAIHLPSGVHTIGERAFESAHFLEVFIPEGIHTIQKYGFHACSKMKKLSLPNSLQTIGESAFQSCWSLEEVKIPGSVSGTGRYSFYACKCLRRVELMEGVKSIDDYSFWNTTLKEIVIPDSVERISAYAFKDCRNIKVIASDSWKKARPDLLKRIP